MSDESLRVDPARTEKKNTGIFVRALHEDRWGSWDITHLDRKSLIQWLRQHEAAENTVLILLGHKQ